MPPAGNGAARQRLRRAEPYEPESERDLVRQYLNQIAETPLLTAQDEVDLAKRIEAGLYAARLLAETDAGTLAPPSEQRRRELELAARDGQFAKDHMIRANLRLVVAVAKKHFRRGLPFLDLIQEGNLGLIRAVEKFDYAKGYKLSTYAMWWIRQAIERGIATYSRTIRLPVHVVEELGKLGRVERRLQLRLDRDPTVDELAAEAGSTADRVVELRQLARESISLDTPLGDDGEATVGDLIEDVDVLQGSNVVEYQAFAEQLRALVDTLPPREAMIITMRYGLHNGRPYTLQEVADHLGLTRERIRQLEKGALTQLRDPERHEPLAAWAS